MAIPVLERRFQLLNRLAVIQGLRKLFGRILAGFPCTTMPGTWGETRLSYLRCPVSKSDALLVRRAFVLRPLVRKNRPPKKLLGSRTLKRSYGERGRWQPCVYDTVIQ